jgi:hypothetical protein
MLGDQAALNLEPGDEMIKVSNSDTEKPRESMNDDMTSPIQWLNRPFED